MNLPEHYVFRFDIAVDDTGGVSGAKSVCDLTSDVQSIEWRDLFAREFVAEGDSLDVLHRDEVTIILSYSNLVDYADVGMI